MSITVATDKENELWEAEYSKMAKYRVAQKVKYQNK